MALFQTETLEVQPARAQSNSRQGVSLPSGASFTLHYPKSYIPPLPTFFPTSTLTFLKLCVLQVSLCAEQVLQYMPKFCPSVPCAGVTNIQVCIQLCSGTSAPPRRSLREYLAPLPGRRSGACLETACPQLLAEGLGASRGALDGWWPCMPSPPSPLPLLSPLLLLL